MKSGIILIVVGLLMFLTALWGGAWLCSVFPEGTTYGFPALTSSLFFGIIGIVLACVGGYKVDKKP